MRDKEKRLIITFSSTVQAMKFETAAKVVKAPGRIIPVPREITAGCGLAYSAPPETREILNKLLQDNNLTAENMLELLI